MPRRIAAALWMLVGPALVACGSSEPDSSQTAGAGAKLPDVEFVVHLTIDPGGEVQQCQLVQMPSNRGTIAVNSAESHFTPGSHHFVALRTSQTSIPDSLGSGLTDCMETTAASLTIVSGGYYEAQQPDMRHDLPTGVAHLFKPGEVMVLQTHYLNATQAPLDAKVTFTLHTMDPKKVQHEAGSIVFSNFNIDVPPFSKSTATRTCPVSKTDDMNLLMLWSHMHRRAVRFVATTDDPAVTAPLYEATDWNEPQPRIFGNDPPTTVHQGSHITFSCDYDNPTSSTFVFGSSAVTNEMCLLHGTYWPRADPITELCLAGSGPPTPAANGGFDAGALRDAGLD